MNVVVRIPDELATRLGLSGHDLERRALEALMLESYRAGRMSTDDLGEALGFAVSSQVEDFLKARGVLEPSRTEDRRAHIADTVTISVDEYARLKRRDRQVCRVEDLPEDIVDQIARVEMDPRHDHLNDLLKDWTP